jgi:hypothetical protein
VASGEGLFGRWSRLKRESRERARRPPKRGGAAPRETLAAPAAAADGAKDPAAAKRDETRAAGTPASPPAVADLPPIESLTKDSDFTAFMRAGVPDALKQAALRKLWRTDPVFLKQEELHDCFGDYTNAPLITEKDTAYKVGRGFLDPDEEPAADKAAEAAEAAEDAEAPAAPAAPAASGPPAEPERKDEPTEATAGGPDPAADSQAPKKA